MAAPLARRLRRRRLRVLAVGMVLAAVAAWLAWGKWQFLAKAQRFEGEVVRMDDSRDSESFYPVVAYTDAQGQARELASSFGSDPPRWDIGERVGVLVLPGQPDSAQFDAPLSMWGWTFALVDVALLAFAYSGIGWLRDARAARRREAARRAGHAVLAHFVRVEGCGYTVDGVEPRRIVAGWTDPATGREHEFLSEDLGFDPTPWAKRAGAFTVYVDPRDPRVHCVDISFLPETLA